MRAYRDEEIAIIYGAFEESISRGGNGWDDISGLPGYGPAPGREGVVMARLSNLLACLGEMPVWDVAGDARDDAFGKLLDRICPAGLVVMHGRRVPDRALPLEHIFISTRGVVVVGSSFEPPGEGGAHKRSNGTEGASKPACSDPVRGTLRRARALRTWLEEMGWETVPVTAAVCSGGAVPRSTGSPFVLGNLWLGAVQYLPAWLGSGGDLDGQAMEVLACFLGTELPAV